MRRTIALALIVMSSLSAAAAPHFSFQDVPEGVLLGAPGAVSIAVGVSASGWQADVVGSLTPRIDVAVKVNAQNLFRPELRLLVVRDLLPLNVSLAAREDRVMLAATLLLGPVHVSFGRAWFADEMRWGIVKWAASQRLTLVVGVDERDGSFGPIAGLRIHPGTWRTWGASLVYSNRSLRLTLGGTL